MSLIARIRVEATLVEDQVEALAENDEMIRGILRDMMILGHDLLKA